jgi:hypothetical protein
LFTRRSLGDRAVTQEASDEEVLMAHITINIAEAKACVEEAAALANDPTALTKPLVQSWVELVKTFSATCEKVKYRSSIAVLGNALLAKAANPLVDVFSLKASADDPGAYDARRTAENVLVPAAQRHKFHLGVTGPQPLNNLTFLRHHRIEARMTVRDNARPLLAELIQLLHQIRPMRRAEAIEALAAFVIVRREFIVKYPQPPQKLAISTQTQLIAVVDKFVRASSERGGRAMACSAGLMDATFGEARVHLGKVNDPDRRVPGDIALRSSSSPDAPYERVLEIRDKAVHPHTVHPPVIKAAKLGIRKVTVVAVSSDQSPFDVELSRADAKDAGVDLTIFLGWTEFVRSLTEWAAKTEQDWVEATVVHIRSRLEELGQSASSVEDWDTLTAKTNSN